MPINTTSRVQLSQTRPRRRPLPKGPARAIPGHEFITSTAKYVAEFCKLNHLTNCHVFTE